LSPSPSISANSGDILLYGTFSTLIVSIIAFALPSQSVIMNLSPTLGMGILFFLYHHKDVAVACFIPLITNLTHWSASFLLSQKYNDDGVFFVLFFGFSFKKLFHNLFAEL
jgi:hypothetical protein